MTQQSAVLLIAFLAGLVVAAVLLGTARRNVQPRFAMVSPDVQMRERLVWPAQLL